MIEMVIGFTVVIVFVFGFYRLMLHKQKQTVKQETIGMLEKYGKISLKDKQIIFQNNLEIYEILFFRVSPQHELTINSASIWEIHTSGKSILVNQNLFLSSELPKLIILYPMKSRVKRYINENELVFIDYRDVFNNMRLIRFHELDTFLSETYQNKKEVKRR